MDGDRDRAESVHRYRSLAAELISTTEARPEANADVVIDNADFERPVLLRS
jgi:hypothetical protein